MTTATALRVVCGHDSRSIEGCLHCEAADELEAYARALAAPAALIVPPDVMRAAERMAKPLHESRLSGATAEEDARCAWLVLSFLRAHEEPK